MSKRKTILYIIDFNLSEINGSQHLQISLIEDLILSGYDVLLIQPKIMEFILPQNLSSYSNLKIISIDKSPFKKTDLIKRYFSAKKYFKSVVNYIDKKQISFDYVYFLSTPLTHYFIRKIKKITKKPLIYHIQDLYPESLGTTVMSRAKPIINFLKRRQKKSFELVEKIIVISEDIKDALINKKISSKKIFVVPNWYWDIERVNDNKNRFMKKYNIVKKQFVVQYAGNFGRVLDYNFVVKIMKKLETQKEIIFHFIGNGSKDKHFKSLIKKNKIKNVVFYPMQPFELVKDINSYVDLCFIPLKNNVIYHSVPSKASIAHALGIPALIVSNTDSKYSMNIIENNVGQVTNNYEIDKAVDFILNMKNQSDKYNIVSKNAIKYASEYLTRKRNTNKIIKIFDNTVIGDGQDV